MLCNLAKTFKVLRNIHAIKLEKLSDKLNNLSKPAKNFNDKIRFYVTPKTSQVEPLGQLTSLDRRDYIPPKESGQITSIDEATRLRFLSNQKKRFKFKNIWYPERHEVNGMVKDMNEDVKLGNSEFALYTKEEMIELAERIFLCRDCKYNSRNVSEQKLMRKKGDIDKRKSLQDNPDYNPIPHCVLSRELIETIVKDMDNKCSAEDFNYTTGHRITVKW